MSLEISQNLSMLEKNSKAIRLDLQTWTDVEEYLKHCRGIILPLGSTEQHGPTGAIGTDALTAEAVALEVGCRTGVLVAPTQAFGMAEHHLAFPGTMSLKPSTLLALLHDLVLSLAANGFERIFVINGHGGNISTAKAAFMQAYSTVESRKLPIASRFQCKIANWFLAAPVFSAAKELYGDKEGQHATPSEIALTLHLEPSLKTKQRSLPKPAPVGPINGPDDFRLRYPDGRMGSDPFLAKSEHGETLLHTAATALSKDLFNFLEQS